MNKFLNLYTLHFTGHYPVGAVAVIAAVTPFEALKLFLTTLALEEPFLVVENINKTTDSIEYICKVVDTAPFCKILLNGSY